jgi:hypothetical protein
MMGYEVAYDILDAGYRYWWFPGGGVLFIVIGSFLVKFRKTISPKAPRAFVNIFAFFFLGFSCLWTAISLAATLGDYLTLRNAMRNQTADVVEGVVTNFVPMPYSGHADESFEVQGRRFSYSDFRITAGFNNTKSHGGPIDEGVRVRIWRVGNRIARLEVAK